MNLTKNQIKTYLDFLEEYKEYVGLAGWKIKVAVKIEDMESIAQITPDIYEKEAKLTLGYKFIKDTKEKQFNILFHELLHCKICIHKQEVNEHEQIFEEHLVNDLTRGFEKVLKEKWLSKI